MLEVDIDIRRLVAFFRNKTLDKHCHAPRIDLGDAEAVADGGVGGRAAALAEDILRTGVRDDVVHGQKIRLVPEICDQCQLVFNDVDDLLRHAPGPTHLHPLFGQLAQVTRRRLTIRNDFIRVFVAQFVE